MNRREEARERIRSIRRACRVGEPPPVDPNALVVLREAAGSDGLRVYQLAEEMVVQAFMNDLDDVAAATIAADHFRAAEARHVELTGKPFVPLAQTGMYPPPFD